jgi:hypothetical protein
MPALPEAESAVIDEQKITGYLLSSTHPAGRAKAAFFIRFGFQPMTPETLREALLDHARSTRRAQVTETQFGTKYTLDGPMATPSGRRPRVRAIWFVQVDETIPRFVTAYPVPGASR